MSKKEYQKLFEKLNTDMKDDLEDFINLYKIIKPKIKMLTQSLASRGWFLNGSTLPRLWLTVLLHEEKGASDIVDNLLKREFEEQTPFIFERLKKIYPEIKLNLEEGESSIKHEFYFASIPLLLSLSEYIASTITTSALGEKKTHILFNKKKINGKPVNKLGLLFGAEIENKDMFHLKSVIKTSHSFNENQKLTNSTKVNRHAILHGCDITYGTSINLLKTLSFLDYTDITLRSIAIEKIKSSS